MSYVRVRIIPLTHGQKAFVDDEDFDRVTQWKWQATRRPDGQWTATRKAWDKCSKRMRGVKMHRFILDAPKGTIVDHRNHDPFDNRRSNLRLCGASQNMGNRRKNRRGSSRFKGVHWSTRIGRWVAQIRGRHIGLFDDEREAAAAYNEHAKAAFGDFALLNSL